MGPWSSNNEERREGGETEAGERGVKPTDYITACCSWLGAGITTCSWVLPAHKQQPTASAQPVGQDCEQGVLGHCWLFGFFLCCNRVFPPVFQERNNLPYLSCTSSHWSETPRHRRREICTGRGCAGEKFPAAFVSRAPVLQVSLLEREKPDFYRPVQAADRERYPDVFCNYLVIIIY